MVTVLLSSEIITSECKFLIFWRRRKKTGTRPTATRKKKKKISTQRYKNEDAGHQHQRTQVDSSSYEYPAATVPTEGHSNRNPRRGPQKAHIPLFLHTILGPDFYVVYPRKKNLSLVYIVETKISNFDHYGPQQP